MRHAAGVAILALAMVGAVAADQDKKPKGKPAAAQEQPAKPADQGKAKDKKQAQPAAGHGSSGIAGAGACTPDTTPPVIQSVAATPGSIWSPNHKMTPVAISAKVTDNCTTPTWSVTAVASSEPVNGTGDGDTEPDWAIAGPHGVTLRAERAGSGPGRTYTITIAAKDAAGNVSNATTTVTVPHNR
jgi:hypothetical protein